MGKISISFIYFEYDFMQEFSFYFYFKYIFQKANFLRFQLAFELIIQLITGNNFGFVLL